MAPDRHRDRDQFLQLIARLRGVAEKHGDRVFADALSGCLVDSSGGEPRCPMAALFIQQYADDGYMPDIGGPPKTAPLPLNATDPPPYDRQRLLDYIRHILEERAALRGDTRFVQALHECRRTMLESESCPMHRFLNQQP
jgi:hypothetical protein